MVKIVIDIPDRTYEKILSNEYDYGDMNIIIQNGKLIPKGCGDLIDRKVLLNKGNQGHFIEWYDEIERMPTIIEADVTDINVGKMAESEDKE